MITKRCIDEILLSAKIEDVVGDFVSLKRRGSNFVGVCPFHDDKNPSMYVSPKIGIFKCFVCDSGGNAVHFVMKHENSSYPEALRYIANKYGIAIEEDNALSVEELASQSVRDALLAVNQFAEKFFTKQLFETDEGKEIGLSYFKERGFSEATIQHFKLGYCPSGWDKFTQEALKNGFLQEDLIATGLVKKSDSGKLFDFFHGRVIFPIHNGIGKTIGFGGRVLDKQAKTSKYFNSPESEVYHKSDILYGFSLAKKSIRSKDCVYLVEGYTDVISMYQAGVENVVASSGTALTDGQIKLLSFQTKNIIVLYDGDTAGIKASWRGIDMLVAAGFDVKVILLPEGEDPDSFAQKHRDSELADYLETNAVNFLLFKAKILEREAGHDPMKRAAMVNEIINTIASVRDNIGRAFYIKECAELFQLSEEMLNGQLRKAVWKKMNADKKELDATDIPEVYAPSIPQTGAEQKEYNTELKLYEAEKELILLLIKFGVYEIDVLEGLSQDENKAEEPSPPKRGNKIEEENKPEEKILQMRIDQFVCNMFQEENLRISDQTCKYIFDQYPDIASQTLDQEEIKKYFSLMDDENVQNFLLPHLFQTDPEYSALWESKFEIVTRSILNDKEKLNAHVGNIIDRFKFRLLESYSYTLLKLLEDNPTEETELRILQQLMLLNDRRKELAARLGVVVL
ncbi:MAG: DNA primase [Bacteroidales bacterium]|jgi:DNA primase|nr:DNA primase [Bacteroidales bacterium]